jgi:hypothetical protein
MNCRGRDSSGHLPRRSRVEPRRRSFELNADCWCAFTCKRMICRYEFMRSSASVCTAYHLRPFWCECERASDRVDDGCAGTEAAGALAINKSFRSNKTSRCDSLLLTTSLLLSQALLLVCTKCGTVLTSNRQECTASPRVWRDGLRCSRALVILRCDSVVPTWPVRSQASRFKQQQQRKLLTCALNSPLLQ